MAKLENGLWVFGNIIAWVYRVHSFASIMSSDNNGTKDYGGDSQLLFLPQSDLKRSTRPNLMLMALPSASASNIQQALQEGNCKLVTSSKSSALVLPDTSYELTTIGTSNTLVVYPKSTSTATASKSTAGESTENPTNKRMKLDSNFSRHACRLIQPGGSGSSFLSLQPKKNPAEAIRSILSSNATDTTFRENDLALELQCSIVEIKNALETIPCIFDGHLQLLTEEQLWQAKRSLVETLCEEPAAEDENVPPEQFYDPVEKRIAPPNEETSVSDSWASAVSKKIVTLACGSSNHFDKHKIALWALQDLVITSRQSTWPVDELLSTWQMRLPLKWCADDNGDGTTNVASRAALERMPGVQIALDGNKKDSAEVVTIQF